jgi:phosphopentomutase
VIVLDAVGAGELPDAADYGDEGSNTLGNVARAVGGLDLPTMEALGLGNIGPLEGCPPQPPRSPAGSSSARAARTRPPVTGS